LNYFSHYFVDRIPGNHEFNTGLLLPDVTREWIKTYKDYGYPEGPQLDLYKGCLAHYAADKRFHASLFFKEILETASRVISEAPFGSTVNRKWFLAHILSELMIDRILVKEQPAELEGFYSSLSDVNDQELDDFLKRNGMADTARFFENFNHFRKVQYIYYYADNNKFVYSLNRIMMRAGVGSLSDADQQVLLNASLVLEKHLTGNTPLLIQQLKEIN
jgi:hypothetical protein